jgi:5-bromo-4-chloroindolyl phosphate hydrolysis protein
MTEARKPKEPRLHPPRTTTEWLVIIAAIGVVLVNVVNAYHTNSKVDAARDQARETAILTEETADSTGKKLDEIHELTNSNLSSVNKQLEQANARIEKLEQLLLKEKDP